MQALGIAVKLTFSGDNQFWFPETYYCIVVSLGRVLVCVWHCLLSKCSSPFALALVLGVASAMLMCLCAGCGSVCDSPNELSQQGFGSVQHSHCVAHILCDVHVMYYYSIGYPLSGKSFWCSLKLGYSSQFVQHSYLISDLSRDVMCDCTPNRCYVHIYIRDCTYDGSPATGRGIACTQHLRPGCVSSWQAMLVKDAGGNDPDHPHAAWQEEQTSTQVITEGCGFVTIVIGTFLLHTTRDLDVSLSQFSQLAHATPAGSGHAARYGELPLSRMPSNSGVLSPASSNLTALTGVNVAGGSARTRQMDMS